MGIKGPHPTPPDKMPRFLRPKKYPTLLRDDENHHDPFLNKALIRLSAISWRIMALGGFPLDSHEGM